MNSKRTINGIVIRVGKRPHLLSLDENYQIQFPSIIFAKDDHFYDYLTKAQIVFVDYLTIADSDNVTIRKICDHFTISLSKGEEHHLISVAKLIKEDRETAQELIASLIPQLEEKQDEAV